MTFREWYDDSGSASWTSEWVVAAAWNAALEEAIRVCEQHAGSFDRGIGNRECINDIRALKNQ